MATSGSYNLSSSYGTIRVEWWKISHNVNNNTTRIGWRAVATWSGSTWLQVYACRIWINGAQVLNRGSAQTWGGQFASGELDIAMNSDGNKNLGSNGEAAIYATALNAYGSGNWDLPQVPRASQPSVNSYPNTTPESVSRQIRRPLARSHHADQALRSGAHLRVPGRIHHLICCAGICMLVQRGTHPPEQREFRPAQIERHVRDDCLPDDVQINPIRLRAQRDPYSSHLLVKYVGRLLDCDPVIVEVPPVADRQLSRRASVREASVFFVVFDEFDGVHECPLNAVIFPGGKPSHRYR